MISPMKKILLAGKASDKDKIIDNLKKAEVVHVDPVSPDSVQVPSGLFEEIDRCSRAITIAQQVQLKDEGIMAAPGTPKRVVDEILQINRDIPKIEEKILALKKEQSELSQWGDPGIETIKELEKDGLYFKFLQGPAQLDGESLNEIDVKAELVKRVFRDAVKTLLIAVSRHEIEYGADYLELPPPRASVEQIGDEISQLKQEVNEKARLLESHAKRLDDLESYYTRLLNNKKLSEVQTGLFVDAELFVLTGWCPANKIQELKSEFEEQKMAVAIEPYEPEEEDMPPTHLENSVIGRAIEPLYDFMGMVPSYSEPDTSVIFLLMLSMFSGFLLADGGYGLLMFLPVVVFYSFLKNKGIDKSVLNLFVALTGGIALYGVLTNTYFGELVTPISFYQFEPERFFIQGICFFIGASHLTLAHILKMNRQPFTLKYLSEVGWILFIWAMYIIICQMILGRDFVLPFSMFFPLLYAGLALIMIFTNPSWNIPYSLACGFGAILINASAYFSDVLSYIRLWAVGLAGGEVARAFNEIAAMIPFFALRIPVYFLGHGINIILGLIAILAHGVRLNLLEFSNHLDLEWAGRKYDPFREIK